MAQEKVAGINKVFSRSQTIDIKRLEHQNTYFSSSSFTLYGCINGRFQHLLMGGGNDAVTARDEIGPGIPALSAVP
jgi:hypothetical protein